MSQRACKFQMCLCGLKELLLLVELVRLIMSTMFLPVPFWWDFILPSWIGRLYWAWVGISSTNCNCDMSSHISQKSHSVKAPADVGSKGQWQRKAPFRTCSPFYCMACFLEYCPPHEWLRMTTLIEPVRQMINNKVSGFIRLPFYNCCD